MKSLEWWEWLTMNVTELKAAGADSSKRYDRTGHHRALSKVWVRTVGLWGLAEAGEIMKMAGKSPSEHRSAYDIFKHRHKLWTRRQLVRRQQELHPEKTGTDYTQFWLARACFAEIYSKGKALDAIQPGLFEIRRGSLIEETAHMFGILPIEACLYYEAVLELLATNDISVELWDAMENKEKRQYWDGAWGGKGIKIGAPPHFFR